MKKYFVLCLLCLLTIHVQAQSGLYQSSTQFVIDDYLDLFQKQQFTATRFEFEALKELPLDENDQVLVDFHHAISALKIENPGATDLVKYFIRNYPYHPYRNQAAYTLGEFYFDRRNYREAIPAYRLMEMDRLDNREKASTFFKIGYSYFQIKDYSNALSNFNQVKSLRSDFLPDAHYYAGYIAMQNENFDQAVHDFREADKNTLYASKVPVMLTGIYYRQGNFSELISYGESVLASRNNLDRKEEIHLFLAEAYFEQRNFEQAAKNYDAFVNAKKRDLDRNQIYKAGVSLFEIQNYQRATDYFKVIAGDSDRIGQVASYYLGHAYLKLDNPTFASNSFNAAYKNNSDPAISEDALVNFAKINLERGSFQEAVNALDAYLESFPNGIYRREAENLLTDALINTSNYLRAIELIEKMPSKSERLKAAYQKITYYQGIVYFRDNKADLANTYFDKSISMPIDRDLLVETHFFKAENFAAKNDLVRAISAYEALQNLRPSVNNPFLVKSHYGLGYALFNLQQYARAETQFKLFIDRGGRELDQEWYEDALVRLGDVYYVQKKFPEAQSAFQRAIAENSRYRDYALFRSGVVYNFQNRNNQAIEQLDRLISEYSSSIYLEDAIFQKSQILMEETRYEDAKSGFSRLISTRPNSQFVPFALEGRAIANFSTQNYAQTIDDYKRILESYPNSSNAEAALVGLQESLALMERSGEFAQYLSRFRNANPDSKSLQSLEYEAAKNLYFSNNHQEAIKAFEAYLTNNPQSSNRAEANFFMGDASEKAGEKTKALAYYYLIERAGDSPQRLRAIQRIAALELENGKFNDAIKFYREASNYSRNRIEEFEAFNGLMQAYYQIEQFDSVVYFSDRVIALGNVTQDGIPRALLLKGKAFQKKRDLPSAADAFMDLINEYKTVHGAEALFLLAEQKAGQQDFEGSNNVIFDFSGPYFPYDYWYGKAFIRLAENYIQMGESFQAKATLESIVENSTNEEIKELAQSKLAQLD